MRLAGMIFMQEMKIMNESGKIATGMAESTRTNYL